MNKRKRGGFAGWAIFDSTSTIMPTDALGHFAILRTKKAAMKRREQWLVNGLPPPKGLEKTIVRRVLVTFD